MKTLSGVNIHGQGVYSIVKVMGSQYSHFTGYRVLCKTIIALNANLELELEGHSL